MNIILDDIRDSSLFDNNRTTGTDQNDEILGDNGNDELIGRAGNDTLRGGDGNDTLRGDAGNDLFEGGAGIDTVQEFSNVDFLLTDTQLMGRGIDTLNDIEVVNLNSGSRSNTIDASQFSGQVILNGNGGNDSLFGGSGADEINGGSGRDLIIGNEGDDTLNGGSNNDQISGGLGINEINGGSGTDTIIERSDNDFTLSNTQLTGQGADSFTSSLTSIERGAIAGGNGNNFILASPFSGTTRLQGLGGNDTIVGGSNDDIISGGSGNDSLVGNDGNDKMLGGSDNDTLTGGAGDDRLNGGSGLDRLVEEGNVNFRLSDTALSGNGTDVLVNIEEATLMAGDGNNLLDATGFTGETALSGGDGRDVIRGGANDDDIRGDDGNDQLLGNDGNDTLNGGEGDDLMRGGLGDDVFRGGQGQDTISESGDADFELTDTQLTGMGVDTLNSIEFARFRGGDLGNTIDAQLFTGSVEIEGRDGNDRLRGGSGDDEISGDEGNDDVFGEAGVDTLIGGRGNDLVVGGAGNDTINGTSSRGAGLGEQDILWSGDTTDRDLFILGDSRNTFYLDPGSSSIRSFARLSDFDVLGSDRDSIQLNGAEGDYRLAEITLGSHSGVGIFRQEGISSPIDDDLIGLVQGDIVNTETLNLGDANQFVYV